MALVSLSCGFVRPTGIWICREEAVRHPAAAPWPGSTSLRSPESLFGVSAPGGVTIGLTRAGGAGLAVAALGHGGVGCDRS